MTDAGDVIPGAEYTVINENTGVAAPIYSDRTGATLLTPPYFADSVGTIQFFIAQGTTFRVAASGGVGTYTDRYVYGVAEAVLVQADGNVGIGTASPSRPLEIKNTTAGMRLTDSNTNGYGEIIAVDGSLILRSDEGNTIAGSNIRLEVDGSEKVRIDSAGNVGIGTNSPDADLHIVPPEADINNPFSGIRVSRTPSLKTSQYGNMSFANGALSLTSTVSGSGGQIKFLTSTNGTSASETMRIDSAGNLLVGKTAVDNTTVGMRLSGGTGFTSMVRDAGEPLLLNRLTSDGDIAVFRKNGTTVGSIGSLSGISLELNPGSGGLIHLASSYAGSLEILNSQASAQPRLRPSSDNYVNLGESGRRFKDIYLANAPIVTSDRNQKQDILEITTAEAGVAKACKGLMRSFRLKSAVDEKGDDARIHFGIIAQDLQDAFTAEGLDAGRYAMFMSDTWWETQTEVPAVEAVKEVIDEDGNVTTEAVEAKDAYIRTDTFHTLAEAPAGATERTRLGVRYVELLAFIIAAL